MTSFRVPGMTDRSGTSKLILFVGTVREKRCCEWEIMRNFRNKIIGRRENVDTLHGNWKRKWGVVKNMRIWNIEIGESWNLFRGICQGEWRVNKRSWEIGGKNNSKRRESTSVSQELSERIDCKFNTRTTKISRIRRMKILIVEEEKYMY